jgi:hypothetical protein
MLQDLEKSETVRFHHYGELDMQLMRAAWQELTVHTQRPRLTEVDQGTVAPLNYHGKKNSGIYDANSALVVSSTRFRGMERVETDLDRSDLRDAMKDNRNAYYLGCGEKHYGDFLLEVLCRAWAWQESGRDRVGVVQRESPPFARALYALIPGISTKMEIVRRPTRFRNIIVPAPSFIMLREAHVEFKIMCERMAEQCVGRLAPRTGQPLYLSRSGLDLTRRAVLGEIQLEKLLEKEGFRIVRPESLSVSEQITLINSHSWIVSTVGSACHTRVFSLAPNTFVTIAPSFINQNHVLCDLLCAGEAHYVNALEKPEILPDIWLRNVGPVLLNQESALSALKRMGLVRDSATIDGPQPDLDEYKRRWIAAARWLAKGKPPDALKLLNAIEHVRASISAGSREDVGTLASLRTVLTRPFRRNS